MNATTPCATGCTLYRQHTTSCDLADCKGCLPRPADIGVLCQRCYDFLVSDIAASNGFTVHMQATADQLVVSSPAPRDMPTRRGDPAESTPMHPAALDADEYASLIASWADVIIKEHPNTGMRGPHAAPWHGDVAAWIQPHLEWAAGQDWAADMAREIRSETARLHARWPTPEDVTPPRPIQDIPCVRCQHTTLLYSPPRYAGQTFVVECQNPDCRTLLDEPEWVRLRSMWVERAKAIA